ILTFAAPTSSSAREDKSRVLTFEATGTGIPLNGWGGEPVGANEGLSLDSTVVHEGRYSGRIERAANAASEFSAFALMVPIDFAGDSLELRGWLKYENVSEYVGLWQRQQGATPMLAFDN